MKPSPLRRLLAPAVCLVALLAPAAVPASTPRPADARPGGPVDFVIAVATHDLANAREGQPHGLEYADDETGPRLAAAIREWFTGGGDHGLHLAPADRATLFALYWSARQMPAGSPCFRDAEGDACEPELAHWMGEVRGDAPAFLAAYRRAQRALNLPPLPGAPQALQPAAP